MNLLLWGLQIALGFHTIMGAIWKFSNSSQAVPSLRAIPHAVWLALAVMEILCAVALIVPYLYLPAAAFVPVAAILLAAEMLIFCGVHLVSGGKNRGELVYWLVVAAVCGLIAYGRWVLKPL